MRRQRAPVRGFVLVFVLGALALIAFVAGRFAERIDELRAQTATLQAHAEQQLQASNALAATLYVVSTAQRGPGGFGPAAQPHLFADARTYALPDGGEVELLDQRGLVSLNTVRREPLLRMLATQGIAVQEADAWFDILQDYLDTDNFKRLNGAEAPDYEAQGLPPPRNDWLTSVRELSRMPGWSTRPEVVDWMARIASTARQGAVNPNTAPLEVLAVLLPGATPEQLELFDTLRRRAPFADGRLARNATGLRVDDEPFSFFVGAGLRVRVSAREATRAHQYNLTLTPTGVAAPWLISEVHTVSRPRRSEPPDRVDPFPLDLAAAPESRTPAAPAEPGSAPSR